MTPSPSKSGGAADAGSGTTSAGANETHITAVTSPADLRSIRTIGMVFAFL